MEGLGRDGGVDFFGEARGEEDGDVVFFGEVGEGVEYGAGRMIGWKEAVGEAEVVGDGVDDEEFEIGDGGEDLVELVEWGK